MVKQRPLLVNKGKYKNFSPQKVYQRWMNYYTEKELQSKFNKSVVAL